MRSADDRCSEGSATLLTWGFWPCAPFDVTPSLEEVVAAGDILSDLERVGSSINQCCESLTIFEDSRGIRKKDDR
jgi:hypothetical protein